jgi:hypothetical protein
VWGMVEAVGEVKLSGGGWVRVVAAWSISSVAHQRWRHRSSAGALTMVASAGARTPEILG